MIISILQFVDVTILTITVISNLWPLRWIKWQWALQIVHFIAFEFLSYPKKLLFAISEYNTHLKPVFLIYVSLTINRKTQ
jgi:hypothetical protein